MILHEHVGLGLRNEARSGVALTILFFPIAVPELIEFAFTILLILGTQRVFVDFRPRCLVMVFITVGVVVPMVLGDSLALLQGHEIA